MNGNGFIYACASGQHWLTHRITIEWLISRIWFLCIPPIKAVAVGKRKKMLSYQQIFMWSLNCSGVWYARRVHIIDILLRILERIEGKRAISFKLIYFWYNICQNHKFNFPLYWTFSFHDLIACRCRTFILYKLIKLETSFEINHFKPNQLKLFAGQVAVHKKGF